MRHPAYIVSREAGGEIDFPAQPESPIQIHGNTHGLKANQVRSLERLLRRRIPADRLLTQELARELTAISSEIRRQVGVLIDRRGSVTHAMVGDAHSIELPDWGRLRAGRGRLRGLRCIHTHLGDEGLTRDDATDLALLRLDAMVTLGCGEDGLPGLAHTATLCPPGRSGETRDDGTERMPAAPPASLDFDFQAWIRDLEDELARGLPAREVGATERAILVSVTAGRNRDDHAIHLDEFMELARSADVEVAGTLTQNRPRVDPKTVVGQGKLRDLIIQAFQQDVDLVIFDQDLTPTQARNLASRMELRVIDRTQLILDIFAQNATSRDGKLQVELAQLKYRLPHLAQRSDVSLSRLAGGIGGRGPGETKLEVDRRRVRSRITRLESELKKLGSQRSSRRQRRSRRNTPVLSIVGYTNAGKSTLLRALTHSDVPIEDKMFATLDPVSRRLRFPREREVIITDTVGFIRDLPEDLVTAFQATLEELLDATAFLHVVDASAPDFERHIEAVRKVLDEIGLANTPEMLVFNQVDQLPPDEGAALARLHGGVPVSALRGTGLRELLEKTETLLWQEGLPSYEFDRIAGMGSEGGG